MDSLMDRGMYRCIDGQMDRLIDGWIDRWKDVQYPDMMDRSIGGESGRKREREKERKRERERERESCSSYQNPLRFI